MTEDKDHINVTNDDGITSVIPPSSEHRVPKILLNDVLKQGIDKMNKMDILKQRERKKDRLTRTNAFFLQIHKMIDSAESHMESELELICKYIFQSLVSHFISFWIEMIIKYKHS